MANANSAQAWNNIPSSNPASGQVVSTTTETPILVPQPYIVSNLPSVIQPAGTGLVLIVDPTAQTNNPTSTTPTFTNSVIDGHEFKIRITYLVTTGGAYTFIPKLYLTPNSIIVAQTTATLSNSSLLATGATFTAGAAGTFNYVLEATFIWDSYSQILNGYFQSLANGTFTGNAATTQKTTITYPNINFLTSVTFGTASGSNSVVLKEFVLEQV